MPNGTDLTGSYAETFNAHLTFGGRPALVIVDMVMAYFDPASPLYAGVEDALTSCARILSVARGSQIPVFFTNVVYHPDGADGGLFYKKLPALKVFDTGSPLGDFPATLQPRTGEKIISKQYPSAFFKTSLAAMLSEQNIDTVLITGVTTSGCVRATALDALQHGFAPFVVRDACGDRHRAPHEANLFDLQAKYAEVISERQAATFIKAAKLNR